MTLFISKWIYSHINFRIDCDRILKTTIIFNIKWIISNVKKKHDKREKLLFKLYVVGFFLPLHAQKLEFTLVIHCTGKFQ